jgi:hypothetical protein
MITFLFIKYLLLNIKYTRLLLKIYKDESLVENLSKLFNVNFKVDWVGRIYAVFNPYIIKGIFDQSNQIYEYQSSGLNNDTYIEAYIMNNLNAVKQFVRANNLFDLLTYKIKKLDDMGNYLFIIQPITLDDCIKNSKRFCILLLAVILILIGCLIYFY